MKIKLKIKKAKVAAEISPLEFKFLLAFFLLSALLTHGHHDPGMEAVTNWIIKLLH